MLKKISLIVLACVAIHAAAQESKIKKLTVRGGEVYSDFSDTILINSPVIKETFVSYLMWESIGWGLVRLYATMDDYFPGRSFKNWDAVHVEHLLTHTSGYPADAKLSDIRKMPLPDKPSEKYIRSELNVDLMKKVLTTRHGNAYYSIFIQWMQRLGMDSTSYINQYREISTTKQDLTLWLEKWADKSILKKDIVKYFFEPQVKDGANYFSYGWQLLGNDVLLAFDDNHPTAFCAIDAANNNAIYAVNPDGFTREQCQAMIAEMQEESIFKSLWIWVLLGMLLLLLLFVKKIRP